MTDLNNPFTPEDKEKIDQSLNELQQCENLIRRAKVAGLNTEDMERKCEETKQRLLNFKRGFFAN